MAFLPSARLALRRFSRSRNPRILLLLFVLFNLFEALRIQRNIAHAPRQLVTQRPRERIYIAGMHWNSADIIRNHWGDALLGLVDALGRENVFVSVYESGSWDDSKQLLRELDQKLEERNIARNVVLSNTTHLEEIENVPEGKAPGWIDTPRGKKELRRIPFLAQLRNLTLRDLLALHEKGITFDKVLFLNDVVFTTEDVLTLLDTNGGSYAAACSLDFSTPPLYYDTFALRDSEGQAHLMQTWPYFRARVSRAALIANEDAVPVASCWNGIVSMPAEPFLSKTKLQFRAIADSLATHHLEGSECCLIHIDNPLSKKLGVYLNPRVRVAYNSEAYVATHPHGSWVSTWQIIRGLWSNRLRRWLSGTSLKDYVVRRRMKRWQKEERGNHEAGELCLINEGQVLVFNGWAHV